MGKRRLIPYRVASGVATRLQAYRVTGGIARKLQPYDVYIESNPSADPVVTVYTTGGDSGAVTRIETGLGVTPALMSSYVQQDANFGTIKRDIYRNWMDKGVTPYITIASKDGNTYSHAQIANSNSAALARVDEIVAFMSDLQDYAEPLGITLKVGWESEFEVKVNHGSMTGVSNQQYADSCGIFYNKISAARSGSSPIETIYHVGHFDNVAISDILSKMTVPFDIMGLDPYRNPGRDPDETYFDSLDGKDTNPMSLRQNADFIRLGTPDIAITETGTDRSYGDASMAAWYSQVDEYITARDLRFVIIFSSDSGPINNANFINVGLTQTENEVRQLLLRAGSAV